jgi:hypothetical protein
VPTLLDERVVTTENRQLHVRVYLGLDGLGPVVILAPMTVGHRRLDRSGWQRLAERIRASSAVDLDVPEPLWLHVEQYPWLQHEAEAGWPPEVRIRDISPSLPDPWQEPGAATEGPYWDCEVTLADVARLIGQPLDVFPTELYTAEAISRRAPDAGGSLPTPVLTDRRGLAARLRRLRALVDAIDQRGENQSPIDVVFAAGVLAADLLDAAEDVKREVDVGSQLYDGLGVRDLDRPTRLAVTHQPRLLLPAERKIADLWALDPPLVISMEPPTELDRARERRRGYVARWQYQLHPEARDRMEGVRRLLEDPELADDDPVRDALAAAERLITEAVHAADPEFAAVDRPPEQVEFSAETPEMQLYLGMLTPVDPDELPRHLILRGRRLLANARSWDEDWLEKQLWHDQRGDLIAVTGIHHPAPVQLLELELRDSPPATRRVVLEWPQGRAGDGLDRIGPGARLRAPDARDTYRPVFLVHADGAVDPLPGGGSDGRAWGLSNTDTLTSEVHHFLVDTAVPSPYSEVDDPAGIALVEWLSGELIAGGAAPLDVDAHEIAERYRTWQSTRPH